MRAKIYQPARNAMQSGASKSDWVIEFAAGAQRQDALMGWSGSKGTLGQVKLRFPSKEAAVNYAQAKGLDFQLIETAARARRPNIRAQGYAENFATNRRAAWTH